MNIAMNQAYTYMHHKSTATDLWHHSKSNSVLKSKRTHSFKGRFAMIHLGKVKKKKYITNNRLLVHPDRRGLWYIHRARAIEIL